MEQLWGIDLGGTKIEGIIIDRDNFGEVHCRMRIPTGRDKGYAHIIRQIRLLVEKMQQESGFPMPKRLGMGTPGTKDPITGTMKNCNTTAFNGRTLQQDIEVALGIPVELANDANCFAIAETNLGAVQDVMPDAQIVFGVIMGTGVGGGLVVNGRVVNGRQGIAGEWGHIFLDESGGHCYCGQIGCVETILCGPALEKYYRKIAGPARSLKDIVEAHQLGTDAYATQTVERLIYFFGRGMATVINIVDPDVIILGGGLGNIDLLYTAGVESVRKNVFNNRLDTIFLPPKLGDSAGVFGAAFLNLEHRT